VPEKKAVRLQGNIFKRAWEGLRKMLRETIGELRKVSWPTRREATYLTGVVLVVVFVMGFFLWGLDLIFSWTITLILGT